jgi:hypothetical protein
MAPSDLMTSWRDEWKAASVVNMSLVDDPTIRRPGFDLQRRQWSLLNRFRTGQDTCKANLKRWGMASAQMTAASAARFKPWTILFHPVH